VLSGSTTTTVGAPVRLTLRLTDELGLPAPTFTALAVSLEHDSATGAFDTVFEGNYDGTVTAVTIPAHQTSVTLYYRDTAAKLVNLAATAPV